MIYDLIISTLFVACSVMWLVFGAALDKWVYGRTGCGGALGVAMLFTGSASFTYGAIWFANWLKGVM
jgi:hypothetical protein